MAPFVVPTFLPRHAAGAAERAASRCKGTTFRVDEIKEILILQAMNKLPVLIVCHIYS